MFAVVVTFKIKLDDWRRFLPLMRENARKSLAEERECHHLDVLTDADRPSEVFLYEIYSSPEAFEDHLKSPHFLVFDAAVSVMIEDKTVATYRMIE